MKRIILSLALIVGTVGALAFGATTAFFSDTETSAANAFTAGDIDLKIDNESYYNGLFNEGTSWKPKDLDGSTSKFFDFDDLKPGDYGEDTISIHVDTNDAFLCGNVTLTSNNENACNEPEALEDNSCGVAPDTGELADLVKFMWWADDGDNVLESDEQVISEGTLGALAIGQTYPLTFADADKNIWNAQNAGGPVDGDKTYFIGKAWCFGTMTKNPLPTDNGDKGRTPAGNNNTDNKSGTPEDGGFTCDGSLLGNNTQTDSLTADIAFSAVQSRHNANFQCKEPEAACVPSVSNIFVNGGFEDPDVTHPDLWEVYPAAVTGWTIAWRSDITNFFNNIVRPEPGNLELHTGVLGAAHSGNQYAELDSDWDGHANTSSGEPASTVISQTIPTVPGATYAVDYYFAPRPNTNAANNKIVARWNGVVIDTVGPTAGGGSNLTVGDWVHRTPAVIVATGTSAIISFTDEGTPDSLGTFIDDVRVLQTICPIPAQ